MKEQQELQFQQAMQDLSSASQKPKIVHSEVFGKKGKLVEDQIVYDVLDGDAFTI